MKVSVFKIEYSVVSYDRPANAPPRKPYTAEELKTKGEVDRNDPNDARNRTEFRPGFPDRNQVGQSTPVSIVVAAENQQSAVAFLPKPVDPNSETTVLSIHTIMHSIELAATVAGSVPPDAPKPPVQPPPAPPAKV
jgi:hypothetical protein